MKDIRPSIAFFGSSLLSAYWNGAATYYRGIIKYLHKLGYEVTFYEPDAFNRQRHVDMPNPPWARSIVYANNEQSVAEAVEDAKHADILIKASGVGVFDAFLEERLLNEKLPHQTTIFWDVDAPATLDSVFRDPKAPFRQLIPQYDFIFTYGGGKPVIDAYKSLGAGECIPVYNALDPESHYKVPAETEFKCDLAFLGNRLPDREARVKEFFIEVAESLPEKKFILGGSGWENVHLPDNIKFIGHVYTRQHNAFNSSPLAVLNISRQSMADYGFSPATRVFEAAGAGACIITDYWEGIENFFDPGSEILVARNGNEVAKALMDLDINKARTIGNNARFKVLSSHTYENRAKQVNEILTDKNTIRQGGTAASSG